MNKVRVRYAPSPTGHLHIGGARTALFNYLFAKHYDGDFVFRLEDTDIERNIPNGEASQLDNLTWMGIIPDESPLNPNPKYAPYRQMERLDIYRKYADVLLEKGYAYKCYCTSEELEEDYRLQKEKGYASTRYNRRCLHLSSEEKANYENSDAPYTIRLRVPDNKVYAFEDMIRGHVEFDSKDIGDWVLVKANGIPTYNFAVVIDDFTMDITHVFRGEEHLSNTPKQLMIYDMLGLQAPKFGHMTLIVNEDGKKLSKRDESIMQFISQYKDYGYLPQAVLNYLSLLGWSPIEEKEIFTKEQLISEFDEKRLSKSPSMFDVKKMKWFNNHYMKELSEQENYDMCYPHLEKAYDLTNKDDQWIKEVIELYHPQINYGLEIVELTQLFFKDIALEEEAKEVLSWETTPILKEVFYNKLVQLDEWTPDNIKNALNDTKNETKIKGKPLFMGLRVLITNIMHGPDLVTTIYLLGKDKVLSNLK
ncbi:MAG: glutamate--tRNA ligase [Erysipelotrichaceae bacterium]